jgi:hypothetical protein
MNTAYSGVTAATGGSGRLIDTLFPTSIQVYCRPREVQVRGGRVTVIHQLERTSLGLSTERRNIVLSTAQ